MKLKDILITGKKNEPKLYRKFEDFVNDKQIDDNLSTGLKKDKRKKKKKSKKNKDRSVLPPKDKNKNNPPMNHSGDLGNYYYSRYGSNFNYYK